MVWAGGALVVGEWRMALSPGSLCGAEDRWEACREFEAQLELFKEHCTRWFFWTCKNLKEQGHNKDQSFRDVDAL